MSGALQAVFQNQRSFVAPVPVIGSAFGGGFFAGQISTTANSVANFNLVVGPKSTAQSNSQKFKTSNSASPGTVSVIDGPTNTTWMYNEGSAYQAATFCQDLVTGGFSDWYMPARLELEICYYNLKPVTTGNNTGFGINAYAVPARTSNYTFSVPGQTSATIFKVGNAEDYDQNFYWSSTAGDATGGDGRGWGIYMYNGLQYYPPKNNYRRVRAVRRVAV